MTDLPHCDFTPLPAPPGGSAAARRRGRQRQRRRVAVVTAGALAVSGAALSVVATTVASSAIDRLEPAPFATGLPMLPALPGTPRPTRAPELPPALPRLPPTGSSPTPRPQPTQAPTSSRPQPSAASDGPRDEAAASPPVLVRSYDPPTGNDATVCGGRVTGGIGAPDARTGWCVLAAVQQRPDGTADLAVRVCRSSEAPTADLHVARGAALMRLEQDGQVVWRLPASGEPVSTLKVEPSGCWVWTHAWNGRDNQGDPVLAAPTVLHVESLATEVEGDQDQQEFDRTA